MKTIKKIMIGLISYLIRHNVIYCYHCKAHREMFDHGVIMNWEPVLVNAGYLSRRNQKQLAKLVINYVYGQNVFIFDEFSFMQMAVKVYEAMKNPQDQNEFDRLMLP